MCQEVQIDIVEVWPRDAETIAQALEITVEADQHADTKYHSMLNDPDVYYRFDFVVDLEKAIAHKANLFKAGVAKIQHPQEKRAILKSCASIGMQLKSAKKDVMDLFAQHYVFHSVDCVDADALSVDRSKKMLLNCQHKFKKTIRTFWSTLKDQKTVETVQSLDGIIKKFTFSDEMCQGIAVESTLCLQHGVSTMNGQFSALLTKYRHVSKPDHFFVIL